ncbi:MAG TPA: DoxX family protein [Puia sp.]|nr:DoxX family protein [Puia sp.]
MKRLLSTSYTETTFNLATFLLRCSFAFLICLIHGVPKLANFGQWQHNFYNFLGIGQSLSLILSIIAEVFASMLLVLGVFSRLAALLLVVDTFVAAFIYHHGQAIEKHEDAILYFTGFLVIFLVGPGKWSVDGATGR